MLLVILLLGALPVGRMDFPRSQKFRGPGLRLGEGFNRLPALLTYKEACVPQFLQGGVQKCRQEPPENLEVCTQLAPSLRINVRNPQSALLATFVRAHTPQERAAALCTPETLSLNTFSPALPVTSVGVDVAEQLVHGPTRQEQALQRLHLLRLAVDLGSRS